MQEVKCIKSATKNALYTDEVKLSSRLTTFYLEVIRNRLIQEVFNAAKDPSLGGRIAFVEDYDEQLAQCNTLYMELTCGLTILSLH